MNTNCIFFSSHPQDEKFVQIVSEITETRLVKCQSISEVVKKIQESESYLLFFDATLSSEYEKLEKELADHVGLFSEKVNTNYFHFISEKDLQDVPHLSKSGLTGHFILRNYQDVEQSAKRYASVVQASLKRKIFGLKEFLSPQAKIQEVKLSVSTQKQEAVEAVRNYLMKAKFQSRMASLIANAVDELLMNAIYDAPVDTLGKHIYSATSRNTLLQLQERNEVKMQIGYDPPYVAVSAIDFFGSLDRAKLLSHLQKVYTEEEYKVKTAVAGAGIGLSTVFRTGGSFLFSCEVGERTEVTVFFKKTNSFKEFKDQFRFVATQYIYPG